MLIENAENIAIQILKKILPNKIYNFFEKLGIDRSCALLLITAGISTVCVALAFQIFGGVKPCILCYYQRVPYYLAGILGFLIYSRKRPVNFRRNIMLICSILFFINIGIAIYNIGVEQGTWTGTDQCQGDIITEFNISDLQNSLNTSPAARCDDVLWSLFGKGFVTLAVLNTFGSFAMFLFTFFAFYRKKWWQINEL